MRSRNARPAAWLFPDGEKKIGSHIRSCGSYVVPNSGATSGSSWPTPSPPRGAVPTSTTRRTSSGRSTSDLLRDESAHREAEQIDVLESECVDQRGGVPRHPGDGVGCRAGAESDSGVVGEDHLAAGGERVGNRRVVVVEVAHEVLQQHDRGAAGVSEAAVGEAGSVRFNELGRRGVVVAGHC